MLCTLWHRPWDTLACCWDVKQPTNKQTLWHAFLHKINAKDRFPSPPPPIPPTYRNIHLHVQRETTLSRLNFFQTHCDYSHNARRLPSQHIATWVTMLQRTASTHCVCTSMVCSNLNCIHAFLLNPKRKTTMSSSHPVYVIWHSFVQISNAISLVSSSLNQPTQYHDSTHKQWLTERLPPYQVWLVIFDLIKYYLSCKFHEVNLYQVKVETLPAITVILLCQYYVLHVYKN